MVSAWNHAGDVVAVSPLTTNVCITCHVTSALSTSYSIIMSSICEVTSSNVLGRNGGTGGGGLVHSRVKIAWPCLGLAAKTLSRSGWAILILSANGIRKGSLTL